MDGWYSVLNRERWSTFVSFSLDLVGFKVRLQSSGLGIYGRWVICVLFILVWMRSLCGLCSSFSEVFTLHDDSSISADVQWLDAAQYRLLVFLPWLYLLVGNLGSAHCSVLQYVCGRRCADCTALWWTWRVQWTVAELSACLFPHVMLLTIMTIFSWWPVFDEVFNNGVSCRQSGAYFCVSILSFVILVCISSSLRHLYDILDFLYGRFSSSAFLVVF